MSGAPPSSRPPSLESLAESTRRFREHNDRVERADGRPVGKTWPSGSPLTPAELAPVIRQANERRAERLAPRDLETYVPEFDRIIAYLRECIVKRALNQGDVDLLHASLTEYRTACDAEPGTTTRKAVAAMFEAVDRIDPTKRVR